MTLSELYPKWLQLRKLEVSANTLAKTMNTWKRFFAADDISDIPMSELNRMYLKAWATNLIKTNALTRHYFNSEIKTVINGLLDYAVELELISVNKFRSIKINSRIFRPRKINEETEDVFTLDEERAIMQQAEADSQVTGSGVPLGICILFCTGVRIGELCALQWGDIDGNVLTVQRMQVANKKEVDGRLVNDGYVVLDRAKTAAGTRRIYLPDKALTYFKQIKKLNRKNGFGVRKDDFIFKRSNKYADIQRSDMCNHRVFDHRLRKYCKKLDLKYKKSPHDCRRTYISLLHEQGMNIDTIRRIAGHENLEMTLAYCRSRIPIEELSADIEAALSKVTR